MEAVNRQSLVMVVERKLLRWLVFENRGGMGVLPSVERLAARFDVGKGVVREALKRLEALGLIIAKGPRLYFVPPEIAFSVDAAPALYRAAPTHKERLQVLRSWAAMKWLVALEAMAQVCANENLSRDERLRNELNSLCLVARKGELPQAIVEQEVFTIWNAAVACRDPALLPIMNGLLRCLTPLREVWTTVADPERTRAFASDVLDHLDSRNVEAMRAAIARSRDAELKYLERIKLYLPEAPDSQYCEEHVRDCFGDEITEPGRPRDED